MQKLYLKFFFRFCESDLKKHGKKALRKEAYIISTAYFFALTFFAFFSLQFMYNKIVQTILPIACIIFTVLLVTSNGFYLIQKKEIKHNIFRKRKKELGKLFFDLIRVAILFCLASIVVAFILAMTYAFLVLPFIKLM